MIHEYALQPEVINCWARLQLFFDQFGIDRGRVISHFPGKWKLQVHKACRHLPAIEKKKIEERLIQIDSKLVRGPQYDETKEWLINAEEAQARLRRFRAIISESNPRDHEDVVLPDEVEEAHPKWTIMRDDQIDRKGAAICRCCEPLIRISREFLIIDPHIDPNKRKWRCGLENLMHRIHRQRPSAKRVEIHTRLHDGFGTGRRETAAEFRKKCLDELPRILLPGKDLVIVAWSQLPNSLKMHARYLLTERGGIGFDSGFDEGSPGEKNDVHLLDLNFCGQRRDEFPADAVEGSDYTFKAEVVVRVQG